MVLDYIVWRTDLICRRWEMVWRCDTVCGNVRIHTNLKSLIFLPVSLAAVRSNDFADPIIDHPFKSKAV